MVGHVGDPSHEAILGLLPDQRTTRLGAVQALVWRSPASRKPRITFRCDGERTKRFKSSGDRQTETEI